MNRYKGRGGTGGEGEEVFVTSSCRTLDRIVCCCNCFEVVQNDRLIMSCLFAVGQMFVVEVGLGGGGGLDLQPSLMSVWLLLKYVPSSSCLPVERVENDRRVLRLCCSFANTLLLMTPLFFGEGGLWREGEEGGVGEWRGGVSCFPCNDFGVHRNTVQGMWLRVVVDRKGWWKQRVAQRP